MLLYLHIIYTYFCNQMRHGLSIQFPRYSNELCYNTHNAIRRQMYSRKQT